MVTTTARALIADALKLIGVLASGETADAAMEVDAYARLQSLIDSLGTARQAILVVNSHSYTVTSGVQTYTIGTGATFDQERPIYLDGASMILPGSSPSQEIPLGILTDDAYQRTYIKTLTSPYLQQVYYNRTTPTGTVWFWPNPTQNLSIRLYTADPVAQFTSVTTSTVLAPGWDEMLRTNLAKRLAPEYGRALDPGVAQWASESLAAIKRANFSLSDLLIDPGLTPPGRPVYNIWTDGS